MRKQLQSKILSPFLKVHGTSDRGSALFGSLGENRNKVWNYLPKYVAMTTSSAGFLKEIELVSGGQACQWQLVMVTLRYHQV